MDTGYQEINPRDRFGGRGVSVSPQGPSGAAQVDRRRKSHTFSALSRCARVVTTVEREAAHVQDLERDLPRFAFLDAMSFGFTLAETE